MRDRLIDVLARMACAAVTRTRWGGAEGASPRRTCAGKGKRGLACRSKPSDTQCRSLDQIATGTQDRSGALQGAAPPCRQCMEMQAIGQFAEQMGLACA